MRFLQFCRARWVLIDDQVVPEGIVVVASGGASIPRIVAVVDPRRQRLPQVEDVLRHWPHGLKIACPSLRQVERLPDQDWGDAVLLPALVNAHTHLEFSDLEQPLPAEGRSFAAWIKAVIAHRSATSQRPRERSWAERKSAICHRGWLEGWDRGTAAIGEILSQPHPDPVWTDVGASLAGPGLLGVTFYEVLGLAESRAQAAWDWAQHALNLAQSPAGGSAGSSASPLVAGNPTDSGPRAECLAEPPTSLALADRSPWRTGLSPHAPYSTSTWLYQRCAEACRKFHLPLATHLAESLDEIELLRTRTGPLVRLFEELGVWRPDQIEARSVRQVLEPLVNVPQLLLIHGNYLEREDWRWLRRRNASASVVYCPQTHTHFEHPTHPWVQMQADGLNVALGTDSRASSPSLALWDDLLLVRAKFPEQDPEKLWQLATVNGARALGMTDWVGTLSVGKMPRMAVARFSTSLPEFSWEALVSPSTQFASAKFGSLES